MPPVALSDSSVVSRTEVQEDDSLELRVGEDLPQKELNVFCLSLFSLGKYLDKNPTNTNCAWDYGKRVLWT